MLFNLKKLNTARQADEGITIQIRHPESNEKLPLSVTILGADSEAYRRVTDASLNSVFKDMAKGKKTARTAADVREERIAAIAGCIVSWDGFAEGEGDEVSPLPCTPENKLAILGDRGYSWMLEQLDEGIRDRANFLPK